MFAAVWMYLVLVAMAGTVIYLNPNEWKIELPIVFFAATVIVPFMISVLAWIDRISGREPFLIFCLDSNVLTFPRLSLSFKSPKISTVVEMDRYLDGHQFRQVAVLIERESDWAYIHICNELMERSFVWSGWGFTTFARRIAKGLKADTISLSFSKKDSESLPRFMGSGLQSKL